MVSLERERNMRMDQLLRQFQLVEAQMRVLKSKIQRLDVRLNRVRPDQRRGWEKIGSEEIFE